VQQKIEQFVAFTLIILALVAVVLTVNINQLFVHAPPAPARTTPVPASAPTGLLKALPLQLSVGQWLPYPSITSGQPAATLPPGAYIFRQPSGGFVEYIPPSTPVALAWTTYSNALDGFSVEYPVGWIVVKSSVNGHEGLAVYPPGTDPKANVPGGPAGIGIGWAGNYKLPAQTDPTVADVKLVTIDRLTGEIYTTSDMGTGITAAFPRDGGYVVLGVDARSDTLIAVFQYMLTHLHFSSR